MGFLLILLSIIGTNAAPADPSGIIGGGKTQDCCWIDPKK